MSKELIQQLVKNCSINEAQAKGGAGVIFLRAKRRMNAADFAKVSGIDPGIDVLIKNAATADLPIQSSWAIKLYPTVLAFIKSKAGDKVAELFDKAIFSA